MSQRVCPICKSANVEIKKEDETDFLHCKQCGFNEAEDFDAVYPDEKGSAGKGSPYKRGGGQRTVKR